MTTDHLGMIKSEKFHREGDPWVWVWSLQDRERHSVQRQERAIALRNRKQWYHTYSVPREKHLLYSPP